jgi:hypothetical protein
MQSSQVWPFTATEISMSLEEEWPLVEVSSDRVSSEEPNSSKIDQTTTDNVKSDPDISVQQDNSITIQDDLVQDVGVQQNDSVQNDNSSLGPVIDISTQPTMIENTIQLQSSIEYVDISQYVHLPQTDAARMIGVPSSTLSKRWTEATLGKQKWPHRKLVKIDMELRGITLNFKQNGSLTPSMKEHFTKLCTIRKSLTSQSIFVRIDRTVKKSPKSFQQSLQQQSLQPSFPLLQAASQEQYYPPITCTALSPCAICLARYAQVNADTQVNVE